MRGVVRQQRTPAVRVRQIARPRFRQPVRRGLRVQQQPWHRGRLRGQGLGDRHGRHQEGRAAVGEHEGHAPRRVVRVDGHEGGTRLEDGQRRDEQVRATGQGEGDPGLGPRARRDEHPGQPVRPRVHLPIAEPLFLEHHGHVGRRALNLALEHLGQQHRVIGFGHAGRGVAPLPQQALPLGRSQHVELRHRPLRGVRHALQHPDQTPRELPYGRVAEGIGTVAQLQPQGLARDDDQGQRVVGGVPAGAAHHPQPVLRRADPLGPHRIVLEDQHRVEELAGPRERLHLDQPQMLVLRQRRLPRLHLLQQVQQPLV